MEANSSNDDEQEMLAQSAPKQFFKICGCTKEFHYSSSFYRHKRKCPEAIITGKFKCLEEECYFNSKFCDQFIDHLEDIHGIDCKEEVKSFFNYPEFEKWKEEYEKETKSAFILRSVKKSTDDEKKYYYCNRSGQYSSISTGRRLMKSQGLTKIGFNCPARLVVHSLTQSEYVSVHICHYHYGHDNQLAYIRIPKKDKNVIANQLAQGVTSSRVLENMFSSNETQIQRKHLCTKKDLQNIAKTYGIEKIEKHSEDLLSIEAYVKEDLDNEKNIIMYKKQGQNVFQYPRDVACPLDKNDFVIGIMTDFQKEMLKKFGNNIICLNIMYGTKSFQFNLITILVLDEYREGLPVAWIICNIENIFVLKLFFKIVKKEIGDIQPEIFMSDKAPQYFNAWKEIFQSRTKKLICHWHVHQDWQRNLNRIKNKTLAMTTYQELCNLLEEGDKKKFEIQLQNACKQLEENAETFEFYNYFKKEWLPIHEEWANCFRLKSCINTNMFLESFRKLRKYKGSYGKQCNKVHKYVAILLQFARNLAIRRLIKLEKGKNTWQSTEINRRHKLAFKLPISLVNEISSTTWKVKSDQVLSTEIPLSEDTIYDVKKEQVCDKNCKIICQECSICLHSYSCNCPDAMAGNICKHIHLVNIYKTSPHYFSKVGTHFETEGTKKFTNLCKLINNDCIFIQYENFEQNNSNLCKINT